MPKTLRIGFTQRDISTRFIRRESTFAECDRMAQIGAAHIQALIRDAPYLQPQPLRDDICQEVF